MNSKSLCVCGHEMEKHTRKQYGCWFDDRCISFRPKPTPKPDLDKFFKDADRAGEILNKKGDDSVDNIELLPGMPEIHLIRLVRRAHDAENCPHKGNCLNEKEMVEAVHNFLISHGKAEREDERKIVLEKIRAKGNEAFDGGFTKGIEAAIAIIKKTSIQGLGNRRRILAALNSLKQTNTK